MQDFTVYILRDAEAIDYIINDDLDGLRTALADDLASALDTATFATEAEALAYCAGLGYGRDERSTPEIYPLRSFEPTDQPYIRLLV